MAVLCWLGFFLVYGLLALVVRVVERDGNRYSRWHAAEALNLQLTVLALGLVVWIPALVVVVGSDTSGGPPAGFFVLWALMMAAGAAAVVMIILGAVRASQGAWWRCPLAIPFLRRHRRERADDSALG